MLKIKNVSKFYNDQQILHSINLEVESNKIIGLAGPSGSGKSTLLRCIQRLEKPNTGEIICNTATGFMFQDFQLFPHMTVLKNLTYAPELHRMNEVENRALDLLDRLGMKDKINFYPSQLSGGQRQRTALARILMMEPKLLLCDEPTSGLDIATISDVTALLSEINRSIDITMMIASHDLDFLTQIADIIVLLKNGNIVADLDIRNNSNTLETLRKYY